MNSLLTDTIFLYSRQSIFFSLPPLYHFRSVPTTYPPLKAFTLPLPTVAHFFPLRFENSPPHELPHAFMLLPCCLLFPDLSPPLLSPPQETIYAEVFFFFTQSGLCRQSLTRFKAFGFFAFPLCMNGSNIDHLTPQRSFPSQHKPPKTLHTPPSFYHHSRY